MHLHMLKASIQRSAQTTRTANKQNNCLSCLELAWNLFDIDRSRLIMPNLSRNVTGCTCICTTFKQKPGFKIQNQ